MREKDQVVLREILGRGEGFGHRQHVELAWRLLAGYGRVDQAGDAMAVALRRVAAAHGQPGRYHETITRAWAHCVAVHQQRWPGDDFTGFASRNPRLLDSGLLEHFYSRGLLDSPGARASWVEPDLHPLPALA
jgi:hypothetical protein